MENRTINTTTDSINTETGMFFYASRSLLRKWDLQDYDTGRNQYKLVEWLKQNNSGLFDTENYFLLNSTITIPKEKIDIVSIIGIQIPDETSTEILIQIPQIELKNPKWLKDGSEITESLIGDEVILSLEVQNIAHDETIEVEIWKNEKDTSKSLVEKVQGNVTEGKAALSWTMKYLDNVSEIEQDERLRLLGDTTSRYFFIAKYKDIKSEESPILSLYGRPLREWEKAVAKEILGNINGLKLSDIILHIGRVTRPQIEKGAEGHHSYSTSDIDAMFINNSDIGRWGISLPDGSIYIPPNVRTGNNVNIQTLALLIHEVFHQVQYADPQKYFGPQKTTADVFKELIDEMSLNNPYYYDLPNVSKLETMPTLESQAQLIEDFAINYFNEVGSGNFRPNTMDRAQILKDSGVNSEAVIQVLGLP